MLAFSRPTLIGQLDRWWLQRVPLLWRTRLVTALLTLIVLVFLYLLMFSHAVTGLGSLHDIPDISLSWGLQVFVAICALGLWVLMILLRPVGELPLRRHVVTLVAVAVGSYLWLVTPSVLSLGEIRAIANMDLNPKELDRDLSVLEKHSNWRCIPEDEGNAELKQLSNIIERYKEGIYVSPLKLVKSRNFECPEPGALSYLQINYPSSIDNTRGEIGNIQAARRFWSDDAASNRFSYIRASFSWFAWAALGIGILTTLLSYPAYAWRRTLLHR